jgi:hypothetical protein
VANKDVFGFQGADCFADAVGDFDVFSFDLEDAYWDAAPDVSRQLKMRRGLAVRIEDVLKPLNPQRIVDARRAD